MSEIGRVTNRILDDLQRSSLVAPLSQPPLVDRDALTAAKTALKDITRPHASTLRTFAIHELRKMQLDQAVFYGLAGGLVYVGTVVMTGARFGKSFNFRSGDSTYSARVAGFAKVPDGRYGAELTLRSTHPLSHGVARFELTGGISRETTGPSPHGRFSLALDI